MGTPHRVHDRAALLSLRAALRFNQPESVGEVHRGNRLYACFALGGFGGHLFRFAPADKGVVGLKEQGHFDPLFFGALSAVQGHAER